MSDWTREDLEAWDERIIEKVNDFGLDCSPQEFEFCDHTQMLGYMAYHGAPSHYPHWSFGKSYEKLETLYKHGVSGLPYEMVINSNPALAYLMRRNSLCLQILTIAHVYGHNDFFKNNFTFRETRPEHIRSMFKAHADLVREFVSDPSIGIEAVEDILDAAHALSLQCRRNLSIKKLTIREERERLIDAVRPREDPYWSIHEHEAPEEPDLEIIPPSPDEDVLLFIAAHGPFMEDWQRTLLHIVHEEAQYFIPQIETKIMNEGWASFWHHRILNSLELPQDLHLEFLVRHSQVIRPTPGSLNPYHLGLKLWEDIEHRYDEARRGGECEVHSISHAEELEREGGTIGKSGIEKIFEVRAADRDPSFLRRFMNERIMRELDLFEYKKEKSDYIITDVSDDIGWKNVKEMFIKNVGMNAMPVVKVIDANTYGKRTLVLEHDYEGRDLKLEYAERTLEHLYALWGAEVRLKTKHQDKKVILLYGTDGFEIQMDSDTY